MSACAELISACAELILRCAQVNVRPMGEVKVNFLALLGNFRFLLKRSKVFVHLFQKVARSRARSPCRPPQRAKLPLALQTDCAPQAYLPLAKAESVSAAKHRRFPRKNDRSAEGVKTPLRGSFYSFTPRVLFGRAISIEISFLCGLKQVISRPHISEDDIL